MSALAAKLAAAPGARRAVYLRSFERRTEWEDALPNGTAGGAQAKETAAEREVSSLVNTNLGPNPNADPTPNPHPHPIPHPHPHPIPNQTAADWEVFKNVVKHDAQSTQPAQQGEAQPSLSDRLNKVAWEQP